MIEKEYKNTGYFFLLLFTLVIVGFFKTYYGLYPQFNSRTTVVIHFHATVLMLWVILLIVQPLLIRYKNFTAHRLIGKFTYVLVPLIICSFIMVINKEFDENRARNITTIKNLRHLVQPFDNMLLFAINYTLAIINKRKTQYHMRFMIATGLVLIPPTVARILIFLIHFPPLISELLAFAFVDLILLGLILYDRFKNLNYKPYIVSLMLSLLANIFFILSRI